MKKTVYEWDFRNAFENHNRADNFSYAGLTTLFEMLEELEEETDCEIELDVIGICCQFSEYTIDELLENYSDFSTAYSELTEDEDPEDIDQKEIVESILDNVGAYYRWIDDESLILDVASF